MLIAASATSARECDAFRKGPIRPGFDSRRPSIEAVAVDLLIKRTRICREGDSHLDGAPLRLRMNAGVRGVGLLRRLVGRCEIHQVQHYCNTGS
jgi:hypothetical protein